MTFPKISIVTPAYNQRKFIEETILSIIDQRYPNLEYVIVDGGSTDGTLDIIKRYSSHLSWWTSEKDEGMYDAIHKGFTRCTGEIMLWLNSDDLLHRGALENVVEVFQRFPDVSWISGINTRFDERSRVIGASGAKKFSKYGFSLHEFKWIQQESTVWRRSLWDRAGGYIDTKARLAGDLELWSRFIQIEPLYPCDLLIGGFRFRGGTQLSVTHREKYLLEAKSVIRAMSRRMDLKDRIKVFVLRVIKVVRKVLRYSVILDLHICRVGLRMIEERIHRYPKRISVNRRTFALELN